MAELKKLVSDRGYCKGQITRLVQFCESDDIEKATCESLRERRERIVSLFQEYNSYNKTILLLYPEDENSENYSEYENKYAYCVAVIDRALTKFKQPPPINPPENKGVFSKKLPDIHIQPFDGSNMVDYHPFINMFRSVIHADAKLTLCEKLYYLRSFLRGEAFDLIKNLALSDVNYPSALNLLDRRYNNTPTIINNHINSIMEVQSNKKCTAQSLRTIVATVNLHLEALKNLNQPVQHWDVLIINILSRKLDTYTVRGFHQERIDAREIPTLSEFLGFLEKRAVAMENSAEEKSTQPASTSKPSKPEKSASHATVVTKPCKYCTQVHKLHECAQFKLATDSDRYDFVKRHKLCDLCLQEHRGKCMLRLKCTICSQRHNTLIHREPPASANNSVAIPALNATSKKEVILPTAMVRIINKNGTFTHARALLDSGSQVSFVSEALAKKINCSITNTNQLVVGITDGENRLTKQADFTVYSSIHEYKLDVSCFIMKNITCDLPQQSFDMKEFTIPSQVKLADQGFNKTGEIDLLLGCDVFFQVLQRESLLLTPAGPYLVNTCLGYVIAGRLPVSAGKLSATNICLSIQTQGNTLHTNNDSGQRQGLSDINNTLTKFWECEKVPTIYKEGNTEHELAEECFKNSVKLVDNKFTVALPLKVELDNVKLGDSLSCALQRLYNLERRFAKDPKLGEQYKKFIHDYLAQGHAKYHNISEYELGAGNVYFLPHHPVINPNSKTTPVRAVFDASMKSKNNLCLNDVMLNGPVVQSELFDILTLFRTFKFVLLCDIKAMYRGVLVENDYCCLQNILWRDSQHDPVKCIQLQTVTYGLKSSAFLATRCLLELSQRYKDQFPLAAFALQNLTYVDDVQCGSNDMSEILEMKKQLISLLEVASFSLHKWCSNHAEVIGDIPVELHQLGTKEFDKDDAYVKTLGLTYDIKSDTLNIKCPETPVQETFTKRQMLSFISKFFDPLGLVGPILVQAKFLMQQVWFEKLKWDDSLPEILNKQWIDFTQSLARMSCISLPRNINVQTPAKLELVGYADASAIAHGCCLYLRVIGPDKNVQVNLLCSKSRINPKHSKPNTENLDSAKAISIPRLELNSALLLSMLAKRVYDTLSLKYEVDTYLYADSKIVLAWLATEPIKLSVYVANRVNKIQNLTENFLWFYVNTNDNPADCLSRGVEPEKLEGHLLWFHGPQYLSNSDYKHCDAQSNETLVEITELKKPSASCNKCTVTEFHNFVERYSDMEKAIRVMAYVKRFIANCKKANVNKTKDNLCPEELTVALHDLIKIEQGKCFEEDLKLIKSKLPAKSSLNSLNPFVDANGLLRVGGRLQNANLPFDKKHPIILPKGSSLVKSLIYKEHLKLKHAGQRLILSSLNEHYWLINANREIKGVLHKCIICFKLKAKNASQLMGSLPLDRVKMTRPFQIVGTDYAGPFNVKQTRIRKPVITKAYVVIFVCFITKAIHIELASDMTTNTFLSCLKRFIARRNKPTKIYCDNGTYFKGAHNELKELYDLLNSADFQDSAVNFSSSERMSFHFIPSYSPVFGGLWEAGIKSIKYHMKRVIGNTVLTYEEMYTVLVQIESILNSRPLTPMSRDPEDMTYLSPGHFLTGSPLTAIPELNLVGENVGKLSFWKQCSQMQQHFWQQWHKQYLVMLQNRPKWKGQQPNLEKGTMVLLKLDNVSPLNWPLGRVVEVLPGKDGMVRALDVKTTKGRIMRTSLMKVCPLPIDYN